MRVARLFPVISLLTIAIVLPAQTVQEKTAPNPLAALPSDRITAQINNNAIVALPGNIHPLATAANDAGPVPDSMPMQHLTLVLQRSAAQQAALDALGVAQQDRTSPLYHQWLTPAQFAEHFGVSQNDINRITAWLTSMGLTVEEVPATHMEIRFGGAAGQVGAAFHTAIHYYRTAEGTHYANSSDQKIPQALTGVVLGVAALHDFKPKPAGGTTTHQRDQPEYGGSGGEFFMAPSDFYTIYDLNPLYQSGTDGTGETIAVTAPCSTDLTVVSTFWSDFVKAHTSISTATYSNPPACDLNTAGEVYLDVEWSGAAAKNAQILLVESDSIYDAASAIVNHNLAPIVTTSYGSCEGANGAANTLAYATLWQTAGTLGISSFVSSGDSGAAGCDKQQESVATQGLGVNAICSSQYAICVGGSEFAEGSSTSKYWNSTTGAALGYIPEVAWNESGLATCDAGITCQQLWSSGGGFSIYGASNAAFQKPSWQTGNSQSSRGVPDVSMSAAAHDGYLSCSVITECGPTASIFETSSGTSAATPVFAGIMALVVQKTGQSQGNPASTLYSLAAKTSLNIFHDITSGNNSVPGLTGFQASPGWDPVTGLGSVDANLLVTNWPGAQPTQGPAITLSNSTLSFGNQIVATASSAQTVNVRSSGTAAVTISSVNITGANASDFALTNGCSGSLASGATCTISVIFTPASTGSRSASISIVDTATNSPQTVSLSGTGISSQPPISVTNSELTKIDPSTLNCNTPGATSNFLVTDKTVYLFFDGQVAPTDNLTLNWLPPANQAAVSGGGWQPVPASGDYCFFAQLDISSAGGANIGQWSAQLLDNSQPVFTINFTVGNVAIVSNASYLAPIAPGSLISIFPGATGLSLSTSAGVITSFTSASLLPTAVGNTTVTVNGTPAPLLYVGGGQINAEIPPSITSGQATVVVNGGSGTGGTGFVTVSAASPGLFTAAAHHDGSAVTASSPASSGEYITLYGTGQGPINGSQTSGGVNAGETCVDTSTVTIGGLSGAGQYYFCGLSYFVGVTQINFLVPSGLSAGTVPVSWTVNGTVSNSVNIAVSGQ